MTAATIRFMDSEGAPCEVQASSRDRYQFRFQPPEQEWTKWIQVDLGGPFSVDDVHFVAESRIRSLCARFKQ